MNYLDLSEVTAQYYKKRKQRQKKEQKQKDILKNNLQQLRESSRIYKLARTSETIPYSTVLALREQQNENMQRVIETNNSFLPQEALQSLQDFVTREQAQPSFKEQQFTNYMEAWRANTQEGFETKAQEGFETKAQNIQRVQDYADKYRDEILNLSVSPNGYTFVMSKLNAMINEGSKPKATASEITQWARDRYKALLAETLTENSSQESSVDTITDAVIQNNLPQAQEFDRTKTNNLNAQANVNYQRVSDADVDSILKEIAHPEFYYTMNAVPENEPPADVNSILKEVASPEFFNPMNALSENESAPKDESTPVGNKLNFNQWIQQAKNNILKKWA